MAEQVYYNLAYPCIDGQPILSAMAGIAVVLGQCPGCDRLAVLEAAMRAIEAEEAT